MDKKKLLEKWDAYAKDDDFPMLDNANHPLACCKVSLYQEETEWALFFEIVGYSSYAVSNIYAYGNGIDEEGLIMGYDELLSLSGDVSDDHLLDLMSREEKGTVTVYAKGEPIKVDISKKAVEAIDVATENMAGVSLVRLVFNQNPDSLWLSSKELFEISETKQIPLVYSTLEWEHPDIAANSMPSDSVFFQTLAEAIVTNNTACIDNGNVNTFWKNWLDEETLESNDLVETKMFKKKIEIGDFEKIYALRGVSELYKITFSSEYDRYQLLFSMYGENSQSFVFQNNPDYLEESFSRDIESEHQYNQDNSVYTFNSVKKKELRDLYEFAEMGSEDGGVNRIFLYKEGLYNSEEKAYTISNGASCLVWGVGGNEAFLAINCDRL
ncbi:hypothetical protein DUK53_06855 [Listeria sp. SHR_NRA_18]|uniref:DUF7003 family protein n=1 Tax=Listeria sp. SHR_NRA_18 TaxID=2269046 RepID=UPI000563E041|nr:hypothetical protein [Listeria sp. SHR_NRA_18]RQW67464.1 hypothetical protein DUK53_06855 [Listeria sp. SHR_NRA_18]